MRGCAVGCWSKDPFGGHAHLAQEMGVPEDLLRLADQLFEALPDGQFQIWPRRFAEAIPPGADLGGGRSRFLQWLLFDPQRGLAALSKMGDVGPVLQDMKTYFDWESEGIELSAFLELSLQESVAALIQNFKAWHHWDDFAKPETRASRALITVWDARIPGPRQLAEAAWSASPAFSVAMTDALLGMLSKSPILVEIERPAAAKPFFNKASKASTKKKTGRCR